MWAISFKKYIAGMHCPGWNNPVNTASTSLKGLDKVEHMNNWVRETLKSSTTIYKFSLTVEYTYAWEVHAEPC